MRWVGLTAGAESVVIYQEIENTPLSKVALIHDEVLIDFFAEQTNTLNVNDNGTISTLTFDRKKIDQARALDRASPAAAHADAAPDPLRARRAAVPCLLPGRRRRPAARAGRRLARQPARRRRFRQRRHRQPEAARDAHRVPARRTAGSDARPDRQPAQRRRQGQPVLPARLQPRSRHRPAHHGRRHAGQPAQPRARPGLDRPEFPDPRTGRAARLQERARTRRRTATSPPPAAPR